MTGDLLSRIMLSFLQACHDLIQDCRMGSWMMPTLAINGLAGVAICHLVDPAPTSGSSGPSGHPSLRLIVEYDFRG